MSVPRRLRIYLDDVPRRRAEEGNFNLINLIRNAFEKHGFSVEISANSAEQRMKSALFDGYSLFHMDDPFHPRALTLRRAYYYPFWRIEKSAKRWEWEIADLSFQPESIDPQAAEKFCRFWRKRLFDIDDAVAQRDGFVYIPLQGRLLEHRSFQTCSPLSMIETVLEKEPKRQVRVGFHPGESYSKDETDAVETLADAMPRLTITTDPMETLLEHCDYVATENSSVALSGYFFHKPALLFAHIDFHHIAANVATEGSVQATKMVAEMTPDYDRYLYWFLKLTAINGGSPEAEDQIIDMVRRRGWDI